MASIRWLSSDAGSTGNVFAEAGNTLRLALLDIYQQIAARKFVNWSPRGDASAGAGGCRSFADP